MHNLAFAHGGNIYEVKRRYGKDVIDFSANINPLGLPPQAKKTIYKNFSRILHYPDPEAKDITRKIAQYWGIKEENVLVGNGSIELIYLIMNTFKPKTTLIPIPTFSEYERAARCITSEISFIRLKEDENFQLPELNSRCTDVLFLCNPNNPTGNLIIKNFAAIKSLSARLIIIDEAFMDFLADEKEHTLINEACQNKRIIVLRSFTKFFAFAGLRIGYLVAQRDIIRKLQQFQIPWSVNTFAQLAARAILEDKKFMIKSRETVAKERDFLFNEIKKIGRLTPYHSVANFILIKIAKGSIMANSLKTRLLSKGILIRDCSNFRNLSHRFIRAAVRKRKENKELVNALREIFHNERG